MRIDNVDPRCRTTIITSDEAFQALQQPWEDLHRRAGGTVFQSYRWLSTWWNVFKDGFALRILSVYHGETLVGLVPCFVESKDLGFIKLRRLRLMGEREIIAEYHPLCDPAFADDVMRCMAWFIAESLRTSDCDCADFHHFASDAPFIPVLLKALKEYPLSFYYCSRSLTRVVIPVPDTWESYLEHMAHSERTSYGRHERGLFRNGAEFEEITGDGVPAAMDDLVSLHSAVWKSKGEPGMFASRNGFEEFFRAVSEAFKDDGTVRLHFFKKDGKRFAGFLSFYNKDQACFYLSGRDPHHELAKYAPGKVLLILMMKDAIQRHFRIVDLQEGDMPSKFSLGGKDMGYGHLMVHPTRPTSLKGWLYDMTLRAKQAPAFNKAYELGVRILRSRSRTSPLS